jgi:eukaryotic-like serine/threonine-protein kinase
MNLLTKGTMFAGGRYQILRVLSAGGMGVVYEVVHIETQRRRAMKLMLPQLVSDPELRLRFEREATVTARLECENLVEVFDAGVDGPTGIPFLVMELLRGEDLGARLCRGERTAPAALLGMFEQLARALTSTHAAGIVHRDLKPENLFLAQRPHGRARLKVLDFGIAKMIDGGSLKATSSIGTPLYMAPEQVSGEASKIGPATDLYALGHIAFALLTGTPYFQLEASTSQSPLGLMMHVSRGASEPAGARALRLGAELPDAFDRWFARATAVDPSDRYDSVDNLVTELRAALSANASALAASHAGDSIRFASTQPAPARGDASDSPVRPGASMVNQAVDRAGSETRSDVAATGTTNPLDSSTAPQSATSSTIRSESVAARSTHGRAEAVGPMKLVRLAAVALAAVVATVSMTNADTGHQQPTVSAPASAPSGKAPAEVELALHLPTETAEARLDGVKLEGRPIRHRHVRDGSTHVLEVSTPGFRTQNLTLELDRSLDLEIDLERVSDAPSPSAVRSSAPSTSSTTRPSAPKPPTPGEPRPTAELTPTSGGGIKIDEQNPYAL